MTTELTQEALDTAQRIADWERECPCRQGTDEGVCEVCRTQGAVSTMIPDCRPECICRGSGTVPVAAWARQNCSWRNAEYPWCPGKPTSKGIPSGRKQCPVCHKFIGARHKDYSRGATHDNCKDCQGTGYLPLPIPELADRIRQQEGFRTWVKQYIWRETMTTYTALTWAINDLCSNERTVLLGERWLKETGVKA